MAWYDIFSTNRDLADNLGRYEARECLGENAPEEEQDAFAQESSDIQLEHFSRKQMIDLLDRYRRER